MPAMRATALALKLEAGAPDRSVGKLDGRD
jgi:hypothetical protein